jgi:hypothetical protein
VSPEAVFVVSLLALAVAVVLAGSVTYGIFAPTLPALAEEAGSFAEGIPVKVICPRTTLPTLVELARRPAPEAGLQVLACAEFGGAPSCTQSCVSMSVPLVSA